MAVSMVSAIARTIPSFGAMCPLLVSRLLDFYRGIIGEMCELLHTPALVQKMHGGQTPYGIGDYLGPGQPPRLAPAGLMLGPIRSTRVTQHKPR